MSKDTSRVRLTAGRVEAFACPVGRAQAFLWDTEAPSLLLRATPTGRKTYAFEGRLNGATIRVTIGTAADWSLDAARRRAAELKQQVDTGHDPRELARKKHSDRETLKAAARAAEQFTLRALLEDYVTHQKAMGRSSHRDAGTIFKLHVFGPWPKLAKLPANQVTGEHIADMMRRGHRERARSHIEQAAQLCPCCLPDGEIGKVQTHYPGALQGLHGYDEPCRRHCP
jgi:hypothetical protein